MTITEDGDIEGDETVIVTIDDPPTNAIRGTPYVHTLTITDDDAGGPSVLTVCASGCDHTTIQAAINVASGGETVQVTDDRTYSENITFKDTGGSGVRNILVEATHVNGAIIQGSGSNAPVVTFDNGQTSGAVLDGFIVNNQNDAGANHGNGGIRITGTATPTIRNTTIKGNDLTPWSANGAGIYFNGGGATIENCIIGDATLPNKGANGAGIYALNSTSVIIVTDSTISYNNGTKGAGVYVDGSDITFNNTVINLNTSSQEGGGLRLEGATTDGEINGGSVSSNTGGSGAGIQVNTGASLTVNNSEINGNDGTVGFLGGGINVDGTSSSLVMNETLVQGNKTEQHGGGIYMGPTTTVTLTNCIITGNTTDAAVTFTWHKGGGISNGGAYANEAGGTLSLINTTIAGNYAGNGGGLYGNGTETIRNSIIWDNNASSNPNISVSANIVEYSDIEGGHAGTGNINSDPLFADFDPAGKASSGSPRSDGDFHLTCTSPPTTCSPCVDEASATYAPGDDIDTGGLRPFDVPSVGTTVDDIGADEFGTP